MFGGWPWDLDGVPTTVYNDLVRYYLASKAPPPEEDELPVPESD